MSLRIAVRPLVLSCTILCTIAHATPVAAAPDAEGAALVFSEAKTLCARDDAKLWGQSLCGPILIVDYMDRSVIANQVDHDGALKGSGEAFTGKLPESVVIANTPTEWSGTRWTQLVWPVSFETMIRRVTLAHELFHRIQPALGLSRPEAGNRHLDTLEGRYLMQLEWRALSRALSATDATKRRECIADALAFRHERQRLFPNAALDEAALEINEGVPEYTGVRLGLVSSEEQRAYAIFDLSRFVEAPTFVRSFAYASGPAYGLLLDQGDPDWRSKLASGKALDQLLADAYGLARAPIGKLGARERRYDDGSLRASETKREQTRLARLAEYRARLVDGSVLSLPLVKPNYQFNPQTLVPLEGLGTIYPTLRITDVWGDLTVEDGGALVYADHSRATVSADGVAGNQLSGRGWTLKLKPGWKISAGERKNDLTLRHDGKD